MAYQGVTIPFPVGRNGFNGAKNPSKLGPGHLTYVEGVDLDAGVLVKEGGAQKFNSSALGSGSKILAGINWQPTSGNNRDVVCLANGSVLADTGPGTFSLTLASSLIVSATPPPFFLAAGGESVGSGRRLMLFDAGHQVKQVVGTGASMVDITSPAADWSSSFPTFGILHKNRVWAGGNGSDPHRIYYSTTTSHEDFTTTGSGAGNLAIYPGEGDVLVGGVSFRGILLLFKYPTGIYLVDTRDPSAANWRVERLTDAVGGVNQNTIFAIENDVIYLDAGGNVHLVSATQDLGDVDTSSLSNVQELPSWLRDNANLSQIRKAEGVWYPTKNKAYFAVPSSGSTENDLRMIVDFNDQEVGPRFLLSRRDTMVSLWGKPDASGSKVPTAGDDAGFVWQLDDASIDKDGVSYTMRLETADTDFSFASPELAHRAKNFEFIEIVADVVQNTTLNVTPVIDNLEQEAIIFPIGVNEAALDSFTFDTDALSAAGQVVIRRRVGGQGRQLRLIIENSQLGEEIRISEIRVQFSLADERVRQA